MDKYITIEHPYQNITLQFPGPKHISPEQWQALAAAERRFYQNNSGTHAWTDVMSIDGDNGMLYAIWEHCEASMSCTEELATHIEGSPRYVAAIAQRVASVLALMAFGPEFLLK